MNKIDIQDERDAARRLAASAETFGKVRDGLNAVIFGQEEVIDQTLITLLAGGHGLLIGVPGLAKTKLVDTLAVVMGLDTRRVQFTPDLMPADIVGTNIISEDEHGHRAFQFQAGPIFANLVLADEINRATPKTQSALLEAMQEGTVSVARTIHQLAQPFFVLATQNPLEMEGTYPLPEAQLDRFFFKLNVEFPSAEDLMAISDRTTSGIVPEIQKVVRADDIVKMQGLARQTPVASHVTAYAVRLLRATHPEAQEAVPIVRKYVRYGASPRALQTMVIAGKISALLDGRFNVAFKDIRAAALPALRHRLILNFDGEAEGVSTDSIVTTLLEAIPPEESR